MKLEPPLCHWLLLGSLLRYSYADDPSSLCLLCPAVPSSSSAPPAAPAELMARRTSPELLLSVLLHIRHSQCWNTAQMAQNSCKDQPKWSSLVSTLCPTCGEATSLQRDVTTQGSGTVSTWAVLIQLLIAQ